MTDDTPYSPFAPATPPPRRPDPIRTVWTMQITVGDNTRTSQAVIYPHPRGVDLWITDSDQQDFARTQVHSTMAAAEQDALETRRRLERLGWVVVETT